MIEPTKTPGQEIREAADATRLAAETRSPEDMVNAGKEIADVVALAIVGRWAWKPILLAVAFAIISLFSVRTPVSDPIDVKALSDKIDRIDKILTDKK